MWIWEPCETRVAEAIGEQEFSQRILKKVYTLMGKKKEKPGREDMRDGRTGRQWNFKKKSRERGMANRIFKVASLNCHKLGKGVERSAGNSNVKRVTNAYERLCWSRRGKGYLEKMLTSCLREEQFREQLKEICYYPE